MPVRERARHLKHCHVLYVCQRCDHFPGDRVLRLNKILKRLQVAGIERKPLEGLRFPLHEPGDNPEHCKLTLEKVETNFVHVTHDLVTNWDRLVTEHGHEHQHAVIALIINIYIAFLVLTAKKFLPHSWASGFLAVHPL